MNILKLSSVTKKFSQTSVAVWNVNLRVSQGEFLALTGESGSGKTTLLRLIAGLEQPDEGFIEIEDTVVADQGKSISPQKRPVGLVFQDYALFPHMTVWQNVAFGLKNWPKPKARKRVGKTLELVNLLEYKERYPHQLSGGQQQRVAIARALAPQPKILLLDEPFSNLDTVLKNQVRQEVSAIIRRSDTTAILVTHDVQDALSMADRIAVLKEGALLQVGAPMELYRKPADAYTASFFGKMNLIPAICKEGKMISDVGTFNIETDDLHSAFLCLRPQHVLVLPDKQTGMVAEILSVQYMGGYQELRLRLARCELWCHQPSEISFRPGQRINLGFNLDQIHLINASG